MFATLEVSPNPMYDDLQTSLYGILDPMVIFGVTTEIWPLSLVMPLFTNVTGRSECGVSEAEEWQGS